MDKINYEIGLTKFIKDKETHELILFVALHTDSFDGRKNLVFKVDRLFSDEDIPQEKLEVRMGTDLEARLLEKLTDSTLTINEVEGI